MDKLRRKFKDIFCVDRSPYLQSLSSTIIFKKITQ